MNRRGPRIEPWRTQGVTQDLEDRKPFTITSYVKPCALLLTQDKKRGGVSSLIKDREAPVSSSMGRTAMFT